MTAKKEMVLVQVDLDNVTQGRMYAITKTKHHDYGNMDLTFIDDNYNECTIDCEYCCIVSSEDDRANNKKQYLNYQEWQKLTTDKPKIIIELAKSMGLTCKEIDKLGFLGQIKHIDIFPRLQELKSKRRQVRKQKIYLAHPISNDYEAQAQIETAKDLRALGFEVYAAAENKSINDKTLNPTPKMIYDADMDAVKSCDIFVVNITGSHQDGTIFESGAACVLGKRVLAYTTNARLLNPQIVDGLPSASMNHLVLGGVLEVTTKKVMMGKLWKMKQ